MKYERMNIKTIEVRGEKYLSMKGVIELLDKIVYGKIPLKDKEAIITKLEEEVRK